ncbi:MAG: glycosyltransferase [Phycisphaerae bacterium]
MIEGKTILCFASNYDAPPTSKHHVMHLLAERNEVLWVNYHASRKPSANGSDLLHIAGKLRQVAAGLRQVRRGLTVLTPLVVPLPSSSAAVRANRMLLTTSIRAALSHLRNGPLQVWSFTPDISYMLGTFGEDKVIYYCVDDFSSFSGYDTAQVLRDEENLCRRSDLVITTSQPLQKAKSRWNPNTILVPHGVDHRHFRGASLTPRTLPDDLARIPSPRLGFFGLLRDWVDLDLLADVARKRPDWQFVMIGDADSVVDISQYRPVENLNFLGRRAYHELPAYCAGFDVGLVPFRLNRLTEAVNPIKLREYLAAGLPVVSSPMPEVRRYADLVRFASTSEEFIPAVEAALQTSIEQRRHYVQRMTSETWESKLTMIHSALHPCPKAEPDPPQAILKAGS